MITLVVLVGLLGWAIWYAVGAWNAMSGVHMSPLGWVFMVLGVVVTFLVGAGLMALVFYSSRHDMDASVGAVRARNHVFARFARRPAHDQNSSRSGSPRATKAGFSNPGLP